MSKYVIIFLTLLLAFFGIHSVSADISTAAKIKNTQYANYLTAATFDAAKEMTEAPSGSVLMPNDAARNRVVNTFFNSLSMDFGFDTNEDMTKLRMYVPALALIDTNGYYICYNSLYNDHGVSRLKSVITNIHTWTTKTSGFAIRYYLGDHVDVTKNDGEKYSGSFHEVFETLGKPSELQELGFDSKDRFIQRRNEIIIPEIQDKIEYYINTQNRVASAMIPDYTFEMPLTSNDDWVRALENPTCIAFLQGMRSNNTKEYLNIYALGGGEVKKQSEVLLSEKSSSRQFIGARQKDVNPSEVKAYVSNQRDASVMGADNVHNEVKNELPKNVLHTHWGDKYAGTGCYVTPIYHHHTDECYSFSVHTHTDACYTPVSHHHIVSCFQNVYHTHSGNKKTGTGCYTNPVYKTKTETVKENGKTISKTTVIYENGKPVVDHYEPGCGQVQAHDATESEIREAKSGHTNTTLQDANRKWITLNLTENEKKAIDPESVKKTIRMNKELLHQNISEEQIEKEAKESIAEMLRSLCDQAVLETKTICGKKDGETESKELTCGLLSGQKVRNALICTKEEGRSIDSYEIGCGIPSGKMLTTQEENNNHHGDPDWTPLEEEK